MNNNSFFTFNLKLLVTTFTLLKAITAPAIIGFKMNPLKGYKIPAAICNRDTNKIVNRGPKTGFA